MPSSVESRSVDLALRTVQQSSLEARASKRRHGDPQDPVCQACGWLTSLRPTVSLRHRSQHLVSCGSLLVAMQPPRRHNDGHEHVTPTCTTMRLAVSCSSFLTCSGRAQSRRAAVWSQAAKGRRRECLPASYAQHFTLPCRFHRKKKRTTHVLFRCTTLDSLILAAVLRQPEGCKTVSTRAAVVLLTHGEHCCCAAHTWRALHHTATQSRLPEWHRFCSLCCVELPARPLSLVHIFFFVALNTPSRMSHPGAQPRVATDRRARRVPPQTRWDSDSTQPSTVHS
jgi:hypothetical protein